MKFTDKTRECILIIVCIAVVVVFMLAHYIALCILGYDPANNSHYGLMLMAAMSYSIFWLFIVACAILIIKDWREETKQNSRR